MCAYCVYFRPKNEFISSDVDRCVKPVGPIIQTTRSSICVNFRKGGVR